MSQSPGRIKAQTLPSGNRAFFPRYVARWTRYQSSMLAKPLNRKRALEYLAASGALTRRFA
jgi:hypothetical protein